MHASEVAFADHRTRYPPRIIHCKYRRAPHLSGKAVLHSAIAARCLDPLRASDASLRK